MKPIKSKTEAAASGTKRQRLDPEATKSEQFHILRRIPGLNSSTARAVVALLQADGSGSRTCASRKTKFPLVHHLVQEINIGDHAKGMAVASLPRLLQEKCNHSQFFRDMLQDIVRTHGPELSLVLAWDEAVPGNILQPDLRRKCALTYASLAQMIPWLEESWVTVAIARTTMLSDIYLGYPKSMTHLCQHIMSEVQDGFTVDFDGTPVLLTIGTISIVADADGIRLLTGCKGASALKPCLRCTNVLMSERELPGHKNISSAEVHAFQPQSQTGLQDIMNHLQGIHRKTAREEAEKLLGWHGDALAASVIMQPDLAHVISVSSIRYDPMHCYLSNGLVNHEIALWFQEVSRETSASLTDLRQHATACWTYQNDVSFDLDKAFSPKRWSKENDFRGDASEALCLLPLLVAFSHEIVLPGNPNLQTVCDSLTKLYACICAWWAAKRGIDLDATSLQMQRWQKEHLTLFCSTYGTKSCRPKNHFSLHIPLQWKEHNFTVDCYPCERKHKLFKTLAPNFNELSKLPLSILSEMAQREIHNPPMHFLEATLIGKQYECPALQECFAGQDPKLAQSLEYRGARYGHGQYKVLSATKAVLIEAAAQSQGSFFFLGHVLKNVAHTAVGFSQWHQERETESWWIIPVADIVQSVHASFFRSENKGNFIQVSLLHF